MRRLAFFAAFAVIAASSVTAHAQFGWSVTFDPTQAGHALQQIAQAEKTYTTTVQSTENVINTYNLAKRMASSPSSLYTSYGSGLPSWVPMIPSQNTYGNAGSWLSSVDKYTGQASSAIQNASISRIAQMTGYEKLDANGQKAVAARTATLDLGDSVSATNLQSVGAIRASQTARQSEIANLEAASHSLDASQQTELATLQRINQALLLLLRTQQDQSQLSQGQTLQQMVQQKEQQDQLKMLFQAAQGYQANYESHVTSAWAPLGVETSQGVRCAIRHLELVDRSGSRLRLGNPLRPLLDVAEEAMLSWFDGRQLG
jgi:hypothetical protein